MTPREFLDEVVRPNVAEFNVNFGSLRTAYNAVAAVDALAAHIYWWCKTNSSAEVKGDRDDDRHRERLVGRDKAKGDGNFSLLRDIAKAQKHVQLIYGEPLIKLAERVTARSMGAGELRAGGRVGDRPQVVVDIECVGPFYVWNVVDGALAFLEAEMRRLGI
jgi:hypothetical protein